jgi:hypothetical protein
MGSAYTSLIASFAQAGTVALINQLRNLYNTRLAACPSARATTKYIEVNAGGSSSGGSGAGTSGSPWQVRHWADAITLIGNNVGSGNIRFSLKGGDVFYGLSLLDLATARVTIGRHGTGYPIITSFQLESAYQAGAWTNAAGNRYTKTFAGITDFTWVRGNGALSAIRDGAEVAYTRCANATDCQNTSNSFYLQVSGSDTIVHVNVGGGSPAGIVMISRGTAAAGIKVTQVDGCRIEGVDLIGLCIQNAANERCPLVADISGTQECVFSDCAVVYGGSAHSCIQLNSTGGAGGILTYDRLKVGYMTNPSVGEGALITSYNAFGGQEMYVYQLDAIYGTLPDFGASARRGAPFYCHSDGATGHDVGLVVMLNPISRNHTHGCKTNGTLGSCPFITTSRCHSENARAWIIDETFEGGAGTEPSYDVVNFIRINDNLKHRLPSTWNRAVGLFSASFARRGMWINRAWDLDLQDIGTDAVNAIRFIAPSNWTVASGTTGGTTLTITLSGVNMLSRVGDLCVISASACTPNIDGAYPIQTYVYTPPVPGPESTVITINIPAAITVSGNITVQRADSTDAIGGHVRVHEGGSGNTHLFIADPGNAPTGVFQRCRAFNELFSAQVDNSALRQMLAANAAAGSERSDLPTSGYKNCAWWNSSTIQKSNSGSGSTLRWGYDQGTAYRDNTTSPAVGAEPTLLADPATGLSGQGTASLPFSWEYDRNYRARAATPSIGPCEVNTQPAVSLITIGAAPSGGAATKYPPQLSVAIGVGLVPGLQ